MSQTVCPRCGSEVSQGSFCSQCGASLETRSCPACDADAPPGDRFCTQCGAPLSGGASQSGVPAGSGEEGRGDGVLGWWVAGLLLVAVILFLLVPVLEPDKGLEEGAPSTGQPAGGAPTGQNMGRAPNVDLSSMTPREAADRLFDRVMQAAEQGDSTEAQNFLPMAIGAYERARPLDADGLFHLSVLQRTAGDSEAALETARQGLEDDPDHLLLLSAAAEAERELGDTAAARDHYSHLLDVWEEERASGLEDYQVHSTLLPRIRDDAEAFLDGG